MPLALDPKQKFPVILESDKDKPENKRPTFWFRYVTAGYWRETAAKIDTIVKRKTTGPDAVDELLKIIAASLVGWDNMMGPNGKFIPFMHAKLKDIITLQEAWELFYAFQQQGMGVDDLKKSESPSVPSTGSSVKNAKGRRRVKKISRK